MKVKVVNLVLVISILIFISNLTAAVDWDIYENTDINSGDYSIVSVYQSQDIPPIQTVVNINNCNIGTFQTLDDSVANIYGGYIGNVFLVDESEINLYAGTVTGIYGISEGSSLNIYGTDFEIELVADSYIKLSGYWLNGSSFEFFFHRMSELPEQVNLIPEPTSLLLLGIGSIALRLHNCRFKDKQIIKVYTKN